MTQAILLSTPLSIYQAILLYMPLSEQYTNPKIYLFDKFFYQLGFLTSLHHPVSGPSWYRKRTHVQLHVWLNPIILVEVLYRTHVSHSNIHISGIDKSQSWQGLLSGELAKHELPSIPVPPEFLQKGRPWYQRKW